MTTLTLTPTAVQRGLYPGSTTFPSAQTYPSPSGLTATPAVVGTLTLTLAT